MTEPTDRLAEADERPWEEPGSWRMDCAPHRGTALLVLGTAGLLCGVLALCTFVTALPGLPLGLATCLIASRDLEKMARGTMDPSGRKRTENAQGLGIDGILLNIVFGCLGVLFLYCSQLLRLLGP